MKIFFQKLRNAKIDKPNVLVNLLVQIIYCTIFYYLYIIVTLFTFGEGGNSFLYTKENMIIDLCLVIFPPSIYNLFKGFKFYKESIFNKSKDYFFSQIILSIYLIVFIIYLWPMSI